MSDYSNPYASNQPATVADMSGRHPVNVAHLVLGVAFVSLAAIWLLIETGVLQSADLRWVLPLPWLAAGVAGLSAVALTGRRSRSRPVEADPEESPL